MQTDHVKNESNELLQLVSFKISNGIITARDDEVLLFVNM